MEKKLKDYLHLYLGCDVLFPEKIAFDEHVMVLNERTLDNFLNVTDGIFHDIKPILRPVFDMTVEELTRIAEIIYTSIYTTELKFIKAGIMYSDGDNEIGLVGTTIYHERIGLTIEVDRGVEFSIDSAKMKVNQFGLMPVLLLMRIDLFGLIESGQAIDATLQTVQSPVATKSE